jgi:hypothetical protein
MADERPQPRKSLSLKLSHRRSATHPWLRFIGTGQAGLNLDGFGVVVWTRNQLVHPKAGRLRVYQYLELLLEAWLLLRHHLVVLILHSLDYQGLYRDLRTLQGMASTAVLVPWPVPGIQT